MVDETLKVGDRCSSRIETVKKISILKIQRVFYINKIRKLKE